MSLIAFDNVSYSNHAGRVLSEATFSVNIGDRIGLVGNNGSGKSTIFRCILGDLDVDGGRVNKMKGLRIGYIEQSIPNELREMPLYKVLEQAIPEQEREYSAYKIDLALEAFGASRDMYDVPLRHLSGGWQRLALIARTVMDDPDVLLLDEPTNHLDVGKILHLERWLKEIVCCPYVLISHDRELLDACTNSTLLVRGGKVMRFSYSVTRAYQLLEESDVATAETRADQQKEIDRLAKTAKDFKIKGKTHGSERLGRVAQSLETRIQKMQEVLPEVHKEGVRNIVLGAADLDYSKPVLRIEDMPVVTPDGRGLFTVDKLQVSRGERYVILGLNGSGKSVFIRRLMEVYQNAKLTETTGVMSDGVFVNPRVNVGYVDQDLSILPEKVSLYDFLRHTFSLDQTRAMRELVNAGFLPDQQGAEIGTLSFGQRTRLAFLVLKQLSPNFFIMDEPTNHLDLDGQRKLEKAVLANDNPCIFVSHDRRLISNIANRYAMIKNGHLEEISDPTEFYETIFEANDVPTVAARPPTAKKNLTKEDKRLAR